MRRAGVYHPNDMMTSFESRSIFSNASRASVVIAAALLVSFAGVGPARSAPPPRPAYRPLPFPETTDLFTLPKNPPELGRPFWARNLDEAFHRSASTGRPLFLLFQEIPGCETCVGFGETVLSHPGIADTIEREFVPVVVRTNEPGPERAILERFEEPAWNNPVVRFLDADGRDLVARKDEVWTTGEIAERMVAALEAAARPVPESLHLFAAELDVGRLRRAAFATSHAEDGEAALGSAPGVVSARAGRAEGRDAVEVVYNSSLTSESELQAIAARRGYDRVAAAGLVTRDDCERERSLSMSPLRVLPLTPAQAVRVNASLDAGEDPLPWLTTRQTELAREVTTLSLAHPEAIADLERPADPSELGAYEKRLLARLAQERRKNEPAGN